MALSDASAYPSASLWRHPDFMKLWIGETVSVFGSQFTMLAMPLIATLLLNATAVEMGILNAVDTLPFLLVGLAAGVWVDRLRRRPILILADVGRALVLSWVPLAAWLGILRLEHLYVVGLLVGLFTVFFDVAYQAYLPALVNRSQLVEGNSKLEVSRSASTLAGPALAGVFIQAFSAPLAMALDAASFLWSAAFVALIRKPEPAPESADSRSFWSDLREGLGVVFGDTRLRAIASCTGTGNLFNSAIWSLYVLFAVRELGLDPARLGFVFSVGSASALAGVLLAGWSSQRFGLGSTIVGSALGWGLAGVPLVFASPDTAVFLLTLGWLIGSLANPIYNINQVSLRQAIVPDQLQGRMNATMRFIVWGTMPLGALIGGALGEAIGLRPAIAVFALGELLSFLWLLPSPVPGLDRIPAWVPSGSDSSPS